MNSRHDNSRGLRFIPRVEGLEDRTVPSGNVRVVIGDGILYVAGDDNANQIWIAGAGKNSVVIRSLDNTTTINGQSNPLFVGGIKRGYYIRMNGGNDTLVASGTRSNGQLDVGLGEGDDIFNLIDAGHRKETVINGDGGNDTITLSGSAFRRAIFVNTGSGSDQVTANQIGVMDLWMLNPAGNDFFDNQGSAIGRPNITGFAPGQRPPAPTSPAPPSPPTPPDTAAPTTAFALANDSGASNTDTITNDPRVNVTVTDASAIARLRAGFDTSTTTNYTDVLPNLSNGTLSLTTQLITTINGGNALSNAQHTLFLDVADAAGNSDLRQFTFTLDTVAPAEPLYDLAPLSDTGITGDLRTDSDTVTLTGTAEAGITLELSRAAAPGVPGTGTVLARTTASSNGTFIFNNVALNIGPNSFAVRAVDVAGNVGGTLAQTFTRNTPPTVNSPIGAQTTTVGNNLTFDLTNTFVDAEIVARLAVNYPTSQTGTIDINLFNTQAPATVANFLAYVNSADPAQNYDGTIFHRLVQGFVLQGGGFKFDPTGTDTDSIFPETTKFSPVANQPSVSNTRGTIAMAKSAPDNATSEFFFNLEDNSATLDNVNNQGSFTVFGQVMSGTQGTIDALAGLSTYGGNASGTDLPGAPPFPLRSGANVNSFPTNITAADLAIVTTARQLTAAERMSFLVTGNTNSAVADTSIDNATGVLTVTPKALGTTMITVRATDLDGSQTTTQFTVTVN